MIILGIQYSINKVFVFQLDLTNPTSPLIKKFDLPFSKSNGEGALLDMANGKLILYGKSIDVLDLNS